MRMRLAVPVVALAPAALLVCVSAPGFVLAPGTAREATAAEEFVVIAHSSVVGSKVKRADLAAVFLKKAARWSGGGGLAVPVDQSGTSAVRKAFSQAVIQLPVDQVLQYWQRQMFVPSGLRPPLVKGSDAEVIQFVAKNAGAVGYIAPGSELPAEVKALAVAE